MNVQYKILLVDFNLPHIRWNNYTSETGATEFNTLVMEKVRDCFLTQHIHHITRMRGHDNGNSLDLLFSNEEPIVEETKVDSSLGKSNHACIFFSVDIQVEDKSKRLIYMYEKVDYQLMKKRLDIDWKHYLSQDVDTTQMEEIYHQTTRSCGGVHT